MRKSIFESFLAALLLARLELTFCNLNDRMVRTICYQGSSLKCNDGNKMMAKKLSPIFAELMENPDLHLVVLYDEENEDVLESLALSPSDFFYTKTLFRYDGKNQTIQQMLISTKTHSVIVTLCSPWSTVNTFRMVSRQKFKVHPLSWLLVSKGENGTDVILNGIEGLFHDGTQVTIMTDIPEGHFRFLSAILDAEGFISFYKWIEGPAINSNSLYGRVSRSKKNTRISFHGRELRMAANEYAGFFVTDSEGSISGVDVSIAEALSDTLNFTYSIVRPEDGLWGNPLPDGTVTGLVGMVTRRDADFALCSVSVTGLRETVVDFAYPYHHDSLAIFTKAPKEVNRALAVFAPFTMQSWICIVASVLLIGVILKIESMVARSLLKDSFDWSLQKYSYNMFRNMMIQGNLLRSHHWPQRIIFFTWYVFCLLISALYSGVLTAVLAIPAFETPVNFLADLPRAVEEGFTITVLKHSADAALFREATEGIYKETWNLFNHKEPSESFVERPDIGVRRVMEGRYIFISFRISNEILVNKFGKHKFHIARETFYPLGIGIACPPGAPYKDTFSELLLKMIEGGLISKWFKDEMDKFSGKSFGATMDERSSAITLKHLQAAFFIILLGFCISGVTFIAENIVNVA